ncbi:MAG TPA: MDR family MFS transporter [Ktedonobacteraceae bacterium]|nr:MDR family MFS transporter [Ktedonobacteraceae bacterium]
MSQEETTVSPGKSAPSSSERQRIQGFALISVLAALMLTLLLEALDQTSVGTALPRIVGELQGFDRYSWVVTAYLLASTTMIPIISKLSDQFGRKWFLVSGTVIFLLGSVLSGLSQTMDQLIIFRAIQGLGAGMGIALVFTVVGDLFPPAERARWQGVFSGVYGFSSVVGPTLGGWLTDHGPLVGNLVTDATRWRWVFYINLPVGIIALVALLIYMPTNLSLRSAYRGLAALRRVDFLGALMASAATICLLLGLTWGSDATYSWNSPQIIGILAAAGVLYILFMVVERFAREPLLPLDLFRNQVFAADTSVALFMGMILLPLVIYLPLFLQGVLGQSATNSGAVITPLTVSLVIGAAVSGQLIGRIGRYHILTLIGISLLGVGVFLMTRMTATTSSWEAGGYMIIAGLGMGMFFPVQTLAVQNAIPRNRMGVGTGVVTYLRALGQTLGVAVVGTVVNNTVASDLPNRVPASTMQQLTPAGWKAATNTQILINQDYRNAVVHTAQQAAATHATANIPPGPQHDAVAQQAAQQAAHMLVTVFDALKQSLVQGIQNGFLIVLIFCACAFIAAIFLKDIPLVKSWQEKKTAETSKQPVEENTKTSIS